MNCLTCMNGNSATNMFKLSPPTIEQYLPLDEELELAPLTVFDVHDDMFANGGDADDVSGNEGSDGDSDVEF